MNNNVKGKKNMNDEWKESPLWQAQKARRNNYSFMKKSSTHNENIIKSYNTKCVYSLQYIIHRGSEIK